ncbi:MAG: prepilin peptidase [Candidatus Riflebacteria bacterium]|nr:prepilin peptidase [Candidatus Riflebacteria bacterium]
MFLFTVSIALLGLFVGAVLASWIDRLPYEDIETSVRLPPLGATLLRWGRRRQGGRLAAESDPEPRQDPWLRRRQRYLARGRHLEEDFNRLAWYERFPVLSLFLGSRSPLLRWYDKLPLLPYFIYAVKFSNYRALKPGLTCLKCGYRFSFLEHVPFAYLFARDGVGRGGRCPRCGAPRGWLKTMIEVATAFIFGAFALRFGPTWLLAGHLVLIAAFVVCAVVDWQFQIIPDEINTAGLALGFLYCGATQAMMALGWLADSSLAPWIVYEYDRPYSVITLTDSLTGCVLGAGALLLLGRIGTWIAGTDALGGGDIKLAGFIGAFLGWRHVTISLFYSALIGAVAGGIVLWAGRGQKEHGYTKFAFGPYICMGTLLVMYFGAETMFYSYMGVNNRITGWLAQWLFPSAI